MALARVPTTEGPIIAAWTFGQESPRRHPVRAAITCPSADPRRSGRAAPATCGRWRPTRCRRPVRTCTSPASRPSGNSQHSDRYTPSATSSARGTANARSTSEGLGCNVGRPGRAPTNGVIWDRLANVDRGESCPRISTVAGSRPISSAVSRRAAASGASSPSSRPPGNDTSPVWDRKRAERRVSTTWASPSSSNRAHRTAAGLRSIEGSSTGRAAAPTGCDGPRAAITRRTAARSIPRRSAGGTRAHGGADPGRTLAGLGSCWRPPRAARRPGLADRRRPVRSDRGLPRRRLVGRRRAGSRRPHLPRPEPRAGPEGRRS